uniref:Uncharacterized protein n=1 Tax=Anguilla anguilla TaxID=7936 RepID=A0A0E9RV66_ANGAN
MNCKQQPTEFIPM